MLRIIIQERIDDDLEKFRSPTVITGHLTVLPGRVCLGVELTSPPLAFLRSWRSRRSAATWPSRRSPSSALVAAAPQRSVVPARYVVSEVGAGAGTSTATFEIRTRRPFYPEPKTHDDGFLGLVRVQLYPYRLCIVCVLLPTDKFRMCVHATIVDV